ncbi:hypothetical protein N8203_03220 [Crocinitomicaceae bacterium]|nr:hypothetical protein [Crocinitomicaceae bacterium]
MNNITDKLSDDILIPYLKGESWRNPCCIDLYNVTQDKVIKTFRLSDYSNKINANTDNLYFLIREIKKFWRSKTDFESKNYYLFNHYEKSSEVEWGKWMLNVIDIWNTIQKRIELESQVLSEEEKVEKKLELRKKFDDYESVVSKYYKGDIGIDEIKKIKLEIQDLLDLLVNQESLRDDLPKKLEELDLEENRIQSKSGLYFNDKQLVQLFDEFICPIINSNDTIATTGRVIGDEEATGVEYSYLFFNKDGTIYWDENCNCKKTEEESADTDDLPF